MTAHADEPTAAATAAKRALRRPLNAARLALDPALRRARAATLARAALALAARTGGPVCAYLPVGPEPGSPELVEALHAAGHTVLLPVLAAEPGPLDWACYAGPDSLRPARFGLLEPAGPRLGPGAISTARLVLVPGLAADRAGHRLGRGGGWYDRTLPLAAPGTPLVIVLNDEELLDALPAEPHDRPVTAALLTTGEVRPLGDG